MTTAKDIIAKLKETEGPRPQWTPSEQGRRLLNHNIWCGTRFLCNMGELDVYVDPCKPEWPADWLLISPDGGAYWTGGQLLHEEQAEVRRQIKERKTW